jgi:hypothetical protein
VQGVAASGYSRSITLWLAGYRCVRPSGTLAKTNGLTNASGTATAVNSVDEAQNSVSTEYPRRTVELVERRQPRLRGHIGEERFGCARGQFAAQRAQCIDTTGLDINPWRQVRPCRLARSLLFADATGDVGRCLARCILFRFTLLMDAPCDQRTDEQQHAEGGRGP